MSVWFVVVNKENEQQSPFVRSHCYGPFSEKEARLHYNTRIEFYGKGYKIYLTRVENES